MVGGRKHEGPAMGRSTIISMCIIFITILLFVPWQVAYLGCWMYQLLTCAVGVPSAASSSRGVVEVYPSLDPSGQDEAADDASRSRVDEVTRERSFIQQNNHRLNCHVLLFMTWLLPLAAPVLAVWVRTLVTAGLTTPFDGDHFFFGVAPFLVLVDFASRTSMPILIRQRWVDKTLILRVKFRSSNTTT